MTPINRSIVATDLAKLAIYIEPELKELLNELATIERRSMSQMAAYFIEQGIIKAQKEGKLPEEVKRDRDE